MSTIELKVSEVQLGLIKPELDAEEYPYLYVNKVEGIEDMIAAGDKKAIQNSIKASIKLLHDQLGSVALKDISGMVCEIKYLENASEGLSTDIQLSETKAARLTPYSVTEFLYKIHRDADSCKQCLPTLFKLVDGLEADYNEYLFFRKHLEQK